MTFFDTLRDIRQGNLMGEAQDALRQLVEAVRDTEQPGKLVLTLTVKPATKGDTNTLIVTDDLTLKAPKVRRSPTVMFATSTNELSRRDPRQPELPGMPTVVPHRQPAVADGTTGEPHAHS